MAKREGAAYGNLEIARLNFDGSIPGIEPRPLRLEILYLLVNTCFM